MATMTAPQAVATGLARRRPLVMAVVNCTPDSFHEASRAAAPEAAVERALRLAAEGADLLDLGGQSTRPGSDAVTAEVERARVVPVIKALARQVKVPISIDTDKASVAAEALSAGATIVNDISALRADPGMMKVAVQAERVVLMHMLGLSPKTMQADPRYGDVFGEVFSFLSERMNEYISAGGKAEKIWIDPGIGFGKTLEHNLVLIKRLADFAPLAPVLLGVSRKSLFGKISPDSGPQDRLPGSLALACWAAKAGAACVRVHDALETRRALDAWAAVEGAA